MVACKGFATKEEALEFMKKRPERSGRLSYDRRSKKGKPIGVGIDYDFAVNAMNLNAEKYPYCVQWLV